MLLILSSVNRDRSNGNKLVLKTPRDAKERNSCSQQPFHDCSAPAVATLNEGRRHEKADRIAHPYLPFDNIPSSIRWFIEEQRQCSRFECQYNQRIVSSQSDVDDNEKTKERECISTRQGVGQLRTVALYAVCRGSVVK